MPITLTTIRRKAQELGFNLCGVTPAEPSPTLAAYLRWIKQGMQGEMRYMARADRVRRRQDLREIMPKAKSLILVGMDYYARYAEDEVLNDPSRGRIAAYAWGLDYHKVLELRLQHFAEWLGAEAGHKVAQRSLSIPAQSWSAATPNKRAWVSSARIRC